MVVISVNPCTRLVNVRDRTSGMLRFWGSGPVAKICYDAQALIPSSVSKRRRKSLAVKSPGDLLSVTL